MSVSYPPKFPSKRNEDLKTELEINQFLFQTTFCGNDNRVFMAAFVDSGFDIILNAIGTIIHQLCVDISSPGGKVITFTTTPILSDKFDVLWGSCLAGLLQIIAWIKKTHLEKIFESTYWIFQLKQGMLTNFWWDNFSYDRKYLVKTSAFVEEGKISPIIERVYELDDAVVAFQQLAKYENVGKNVLRISQKI
ncbi:uncharacterized protein TNIN_242191 [Trichonephila inaurata madagascariensis]|uniref:Uncharacterized protein n=1 Tax=Trichonephila inaurata madagascariensis TaxID=2747483 RepID=A0A8X7CSX4_9ARAC|nr:uncharacterized protein TNIN_242191 [Trichonephila inaurata madagascariensis]